MLNPTLHKAYYLVGSFTSSNAGGFSAGAPVFPFPKKTTTTTFPTSTSILNAQSLLNNFVINLKCFGDKQITFTSFLTNLMLLKTSYSQGFHFLITYVTIEKLQPFFIEIPIKYAKKGWRLTRSRLSIVQD